MLHAGIGKISLQEKINSRGNKEQHASNSNFDSIWGGSKKAKRKGVWVSNNHHLTKKTFATHNYHEFY